MEALPAFHLQLSQVSKQFGDLKLFSGIDLQLSQGESIAILGHNGCGKSTLLQIIAGVNSPSSGTVSHSINGSNLPISSWFRHLAFAAPYLSLPDELTLPELLRFHSRFRQPTIPILDIPATAQLQHAMDKPIKLFSSGMQQRVRLALALFFRHRLLCLDEPTSHLDIAGKNWFRQHLQSAIYQGSAVIIATNEEEERQLVQASLSLANS